MRVLTFTEVAFAVGAHSRHKEMARALVAAGHEVAWLGPSNADVADLDRVEFVQLRATWLLRLSMPGYLLCLALNLVRPAIIGRRCDAVWVVRERELLVLWVFKIFRPRISLVFFQRAAVVDNLEISLSFEMIRRRRFKLYLQSRFWRVLGPLLYRIPGKIVVQTPAHGRALAGSSEDIADRVVVLPNSIGASWMRNEHRDIRELCPAVQGSRVIGFVGNLYLHGKGLDVLLRAFQYLARDIDVELVVIGDGPDLARIAGLAETLGVGHRVHMPGRVPAAVRYMASLDLLLHLPRIEACPNVLLEGLQSGVPIVASRISAHEFLLGKEFPGLAELDPIAIANVVAAVLNDESFRRELLARQDRRRRLFDFDWSDEVVGIFEDRPGEHAASSSRSPAGMAHWRARPLSACALAQANEL